MKKEKPIIDTLTKRQQEDLLKAYEYKDKLSYGTGLKTGWALNRKGLVDLAELQLDNWTMWQINAKGIEIAEQLQKS